MRSSILFVVVAALAGCAAPAPSAAPVAMFDMIAAARCWSTDHSRFFDVGARASIAGVVVDCKPTADGRAARWVDSGDIHSKPM